MSIDKQSVSDVIRPGTQRGLDFVRLESLQKRTGVPPSEAIRFALSELLFNALDKNDANEIRIRLSLGASKNKMISLEVADNGARKFAKRDLELITNFENEASSKRGLRRVSRGYLGNALKSVLGYSYALCKSTGFDPPPSAIFVSHGYSHSVALRPDFSKGKIGCSIAEEKARDDGFTKVTISFPNQQEGSVKSSVEEMVYATSLVNPDRKIVYDVWGAKGVCGPIQQRRQQKHSQETSILWYTFREFAELVEDYKTASPDTKLTGEQISSVTDAPLRGTVPSLLSL